MVTCVYVWRVIMIVHTRAIVYLVCVCVSVVCVCFLLFFGGHDGRVSPLSRVVYVKYKKLCV